MLFGELPVFFRYIINIIDICLVWFVIYKLLMLIKGTKAIQLIKGISVIVVIYVVSKFLGFQTLEWLMNQALTYGFLAIIIIFQPEFRRTLEQIGRGNLFVRKSINKEQADSTKIDALVHATEYMAKRRIGALITIEREFDLTDYIETGINMSANITSQLLINIFIPNTPLHDGAVIIRNDEIAAAACYLPLSESPFISKELGTRHRAAVGISEVTDALTIIISEETGQISISRSGELYRQLESEELRKMLVAALIDEDKTQTSSSFWNWRIGKNG
ncbi:MAG: diadenylate cyclase CdaA [Bacillaceae bacterium]